MNTTTKQLVPVSIYKVGGEEFKILAFHVANYIKDSGRLWPAYLDLCQAKGFIPFEYLPKYAAYQVETSCADTSTETNDNFTEDTFGPFNLEDALFTARVNLLGCPQITDYLKTELDPYKIRTLFYVEEGRLNASVEIVGRKESIYENICLLRIRNALRFYGFGDIETLYENIADEPNGEVSIPTLASRNLP